MAKLYFKSRYICGTLESRVKMKVVVDEKIPFLKETLEAMGCSVCSLPGTDISSSDVADADALFVRTRTRCDSSLLEGSRVRFVGTATIGYDHIDAAYCAANGIVWSSAAGCNAGAVLQYVQSVLYLWAREKGASLGGLSLGVVGVGEIGSRVAEWAAREGMTVYRNDPPRERSEGADGFVSLDEVAAKCDVITFHPTLECDGEFPSYHLADKRFFASLRKCRLLINASRGPVVDNDALLDALENGQVGDAVLDVWEKEPHVNIALLNKVYIATPHIAGYSLEGKYNATRIVLEKFADFIGYAKPLPMPALQPPVVAHVGAVDYASAALRIYSPDVDSVSLKTAPSAFEELRNNYSFRREPKAFKISLEK